MRTYVIDREDTCEKLIISDIFISYNDYYSGNPYNTKFKVKVSSGDFSGTSQFQYNIKDFIDFVEEINRLYDFRTKKVKLKDISYGSNIEFYMDKAGYLTISGNIFGESMEHSLTFKFVTDQSTIKTFCRSLYKDFIEGKTNTGYLI